MPILRPLAAEPPPTNFVVTPAHAAIFSAIEDGRDHLQIEATAGSGKTTTLIQALRRAPHERILLLAFSKSIADELQRRAPDNAEVRTLNALGHRAWGTRMRREGVERITVDAEKVSRVLRDLVDDGSVDGTTAKRHGDAAKRLARLGKACGIVIDDDPCVGLAPDDLATWVALVDHHAIEIDDLDGKDEGALARTVDLARLVLRRSSEDRTTIDFDDQLYLTFVHGLRPSSSSFVCVDEAQDLSPLQHELLARSLASGGRVLSVGDKNQALFGFRGADSESMDALRERFPGTRSLPLHVSYRCARAVVEEARKVVPHIQAHDDAPDGLVDPKWYTPDAARVAPGDMVVCRTNAPVVAFAFGCVRRGIPAEVIGCDIGAGLRKTVEKLDAVSIDDLVARVDAWEDGEIARAEKRDTPAKADAARDRAECLRALAEGCSSVSQVLSAIDRLFVSVPSDARVRCGTVHRCKGLEADRVWIVNRHMMPHPMAKLPWQRVQEKNVIYVATTRARRELRFIVDERRRKRNA